MIVGRSCEEKRSDDRYVRARLGINGLDARLSKGEPEIRSWLRPSGISLRGFIKFVIDRVRD